MSQLRNLQTFLTLLTMVLMTNAMVNNYLSMESNRRQPQDSQLEIEQLQEENRNLDEKIEQLTEENRKLRQKVIELTKNNHKLEEEKKERENKAMEFAKNMETLYQKHMNTK